MRALADFFENHPSLLKPRRVLVACSGGPDSVALVRLMKPWAEEKGIAMVVGHVNHHLRGRSSDLDERFVRDLVKGLGLRCLVASVRRPKRASGNLEEWARDTRYDALLRMAVHSRAAVVLTAHTLEDQAETVLMNVIRGAGTDGLAGMTAIRRFSGSPVWLARPLLGVSKQELLFFLRRCRQRYRTDQSNASPAFLRNWLRLKIVPALERRAPGFKKRLKNLSDVAAEEKQVWDREIGLLDKRLFQKKGGGRLLALGGLLSYPPAIQRRFLRRAIGGDLLGFEAVERLRKWMQAPPSNGRVWQLRKGWIVQRLSKSQGSESAQQFLFKHAKKED